MITLPTGKTGSFMIISTHIPKAAGNSFAASLEEYFGDRVMKHYGDWVGFHSPEAISRHAKRMAELRAKRDELARNYDVIHGHFITDKYANLFPAASFVAFFRDPYQQTISHFEFLSRHDDVSLPSLKIFREKNLNLVEFIRWDAVPSPQSYFLGTMSIKDLAVIGLTEEFDRSIKLFNSAFGTALSSNHNRNVNPDKTVATYEIPTEIRKEIEVYRAADIALYQQAREIFAREVDRRGV
jgi:hypothetical protein